MSIRLEWNPAKAGEAGTSHLYQRLNAIAPFGIQDFLNRAQVNRVDAALDLSGVKVDDLLLCAPNQKCGAMYINAAGSADTIYFGSRKSKVYRRLYSKKCGDLRFTRLELELKQAGSLGLLGEASNLFKDVTLHQIPDEASGMTKLPSNTACSLFFFTYDNPLEEWSFFQTPFEDNMTTSIKSTTPGAGLWQAIASRWVKHGKTATMAQEIEAIEASTQELAVLAAHHLLDRHSKKIDTILSVEIVRPGAGEGDWV